MRSCSAASSITRYRSDAMGNSHPGLFQGMINRPDEPSEQAEYGYRTGASVDQNFSAR